MEPIVFWTVVAGVGAALIAVGFLVGRLATAGAGAGIPWRVFGQSALGLIAIAIVAAGVYAFMASGLIASIPPQGGWAVAFLIFAIVFAILAICARWWWGAPIGLQGLLIGASIACSVCWFSSRLTPSFGWMSALPPQWTVGVTEVMLFLGVTAYITGKLKTEHHYLHPPAAGALFIDWWTRTRIAGIVMTAVGAALWFLRDFTWDFGAPLSAVSAINRWRHGTIAGEDYLLLAAVISAALTVWGFMAPVRMVPVPPPAGSPAGTAPTMTQQKSLRRSSARWFFGPATGIFLLMWVFSLVNFGAVIGSGASLPPIDQLCKDSKLFWATAVTVPIILVGLLIGVMVSGHRHNWFSTLIAWSITLAFASMAFKMIAAGDCDLGRATDRTFGSLSQTIEKWSDGIAEALKSAAVAASTPSPASVAKPTPATPTPPAPTAPRGPMMMPATNAAVQLVQCDGVERIYPLTSGQRLVNDTGRDMYGNSAPCSIRFDSRAANLQLLFGDGSKLIVRPVDNDTFHSNGGLKLLEVLGNGNVYIFACPHPQNVVRRGVCN